MSNGSWEELIGKRCGKDDRLEIRRKLGEGGVGAVFEAVDSVEGTSYAIKFLHDAWTNDSELVRRFRHEGTRWKDIQHPNLIRIFGLGRQFGMPFILCEFVSGKDLEAVLVAEGKLEPSEAIRVTKEVASGLAEVHRHDVVHRDLKPTNVLLQDPDRRARVLDFGMAKYVSSNSMLTRPGEILGTPGFMAPEQIACKEVDHRADIFSLGVLFYEMLTGRNAFSGRDTKQILKATVSGERVSEEELLALGGKPLKRLIDAMLEVNPKHRPQGMDEVVARLDGIRLNENGSETPVRKGLFGFLRRGSLPENRVL